MSRYIISVLVLFFIVFLQNTSVIAQDRFATCDLCGYCAPNNPPQNWNKCQQCIYEFANPNPGTMDTLRIDPATNSPPTPIPGRWYTMIGCISTDIGGFSSQGASTNIVQRLLNIVFSLSGGIALLSLIYGVFQIMTSSQSTEKLQSGKQIVTGSIVGLIFVLCSVLLVQFLASGVLKIPGTT